MEAFGPPLLKEVIMPMIDFICNNPDCDNNITKFYKIANGIPGFLDCGQCGTGKLERSLAAPATKSTQFIDNGAMGRRVEVPSHIVEKELDKLRGKED